MFQIILLLVCSGVLIQGSPLLFNRFGSKIVGRAKTTIEQHNHQVSIRTTYNYHFCGGSIISKNWVISAAHCTINEFPNTVFVWAGSSFLLTGGVKVTVTNIVNHPEFQRATLQNDISLLKTTEIPVNNVNIGIISLAGHITLPGQTVTVTGWGYLEADGEFPNQLQSLKTKTISNEDCKKRVHASRVPDSKVCTYSGFGKGICSGDSGGPLTENGLLVGLVSWSVPCGFGYPDGYERTKHFRSWITQITAI